MINQFLTMKELKEALPEIPENSLKRYLHEHEEYLNFKKEHNRYRIHASEIEKLRLIRQFYAEGFKREEVNMKLEERGIPRTITMDLEDTSLVSINHELTDVKKLISFLVQQNEQFRLHQNRLKEQNAELIHEMYELRQSMEEFRESQRMHHEMEAEKVSYMMDHLVAAQQSFEEVNNKKGFWQKISKQIDACYKFFLKGKVQKPNG
ncbi:hypothetical protein [Peribacillus asahii]|uniref:hypothetical protein n=1 Tax=Peribacillus asahii TaxID=228899 RepID=UPI0015FB6834|nr:hypothetical protein [Peribacillus asahii]